MNVLSLVCVFINNRPHFYRLLLFSDILFLLMTSTSYAPLNVAKDKMLQKCITFTMGI